MTTDKETTHTSTAMADLDFDLDELQALCDAVKRPWYGTCQIADGVTDEAAVAFIEAFSPDTVSELIAAARRAARPVAPVPEAAPENEQEWAKVDPATAFHLIERHADNWNEAGRMMEAWRKANTPTATPSSQVADIAEDTDRLLRAGRNLHELAKRMGWPDDGEGAYEYVQRLSYELGQSDASAASRRASTEKEARALDALDGMGFTYDGEIGWLPPATSAPASAGQAAPPRAEPEFSVDDPDLNALLNAAADWGAGGPQNMDTGLHLADLIETVEKRLAAQPAEGAGQAQNFWRDAEGVMHVPSGGSVVGRPDGSVHLIMAPSSTERAAAPAEAEGLK